MTSILRHCWGLYSSPRVVYPLKDNYLEFTQVLDEGAADDKDPFTQRANTSSLLGAITCDVY